MPLISVQRREQHRLAVQRYQKAYPDRVRRSNRAYKAAHAEHIQATQRAYNAAHKEERLASSKAYYVAHKDEIANHNRLYYEAHKEKVRIRKRTYRIANPDINRANVARHRALKRGALTTLTVAQWKAIVAAYKGKCAYCGAEPKKLTIDHVLPLARGGHHTTENVVPACLPCNSRKRAGPPPFIPSLRLLL